MRVETEIEEGEIDGDYGTVMGLIVTCTRCNHTVEVGGTHEGSAAAAAAMLRRECPYQENNFYLTTGYS